MSTAGALLIVGFFLVSGLMNLAPASIKGNWRAEIGVLCLIVFTIGATLVFHRFWQKTDRMQRTISRHVVLSNTALLGGLLLLLDQYK